MVVVHNTIWGYLGREKVLTVKKPQRQLASTCWLPSSSHRNPGCLTVSSAGPPCCHALPSGPIAATVSCVPHPIPEPLSDPFVGCSLTLRPSRQSHPGLISRESKCQGLSCQLLGWHCVPVMVAWNKRSMSQPCGPWWDRGWTVPLPCSKGQNQMHWQAGVWNFYTSVLAGFSSCLRMSSHSWLIIINL